MGFAYSHKISTSKTAAESLDREREKTYIRKRSSCLDKFTMLLVVLNLTFLVAVQATYYPWQGQRWPGNERSGEDVYPGTYLGEGTATWHRGAVEMSCALNRFDGYVVSVSFINFYLFHYITICYFPNSDVRK